MTRRRKQAPTKRLVVDANVLRGASSTAGGETPGSICRELLNTIYAICHQAVVSTALREEYDRHASRFAVRWLKAMTSKGKVIPVEARETGRARRWAKDAAQIGERAGRELRKDLHLVLAALETDQIVVSAETRSRDLLERVMGRDEPPLGWALVAPDTIDWLRDGAPLEAVRVLARK